MRSSRREIKGVKLTEQEQNDLREGKKIFVEGMISNGGKEFDAHIQINAERRGIEYIFENDKLFNRQSLGGVELTKQQIEDLNSGEKPSSWREWHARTVSYSPLM